MMNLSSESGNNPLIFAKDGFYLIEFNHDDRF
jgi:hypothetical protein